MEAARSPRNAQRDAGFSWFVAGFSLFYWRKGGWHHQFVFLFQQLAGRAASGGPDASGDGVGSDPLAFGGILVGPDVDPFVERTEFGVPGADQG